MYTVTFYSFKGGVGRTLALANVGVELAKTGRRVLIVDFDLEAPGMDTFRLLKPKQSHQGIVEYISRFIETKTAPDSREYIYEALGVGEKNGRLWVMPAGKGNEQYAKKLNLINWEYLYENLDGYLMLEDLKVQWQKAYEPDYVLIDSRTGHTDVGGICTRQLPDAVVILFFPNEQNLAGLKPVVNAIRSEKNKEKGKNINLHFVMSNVPDLDDEEQILANLRKNFQKDLGYNSLTSIIHRYDSLSLLEQSLFVAERPNSRLAKDYRKLLEKISEKNLEDRESVLRNLSKELQISITDFRVKDINEWEKIQNLYPEDGEILYHLAKKMKEFGSLKKPELLFERAIDLNYRTPESLLEWAQVKKQKKEDDKAFSAVFEIFQSESVGVTVLQRCINLVRLIDEKKLPEIINTPAFKVLDLDQSLLIAKDLNYCKTGLLTSVELLSRHVNNTTANIDDQNNLKQNLVLSFIGLARFKEAMKFFGNVRPDPNYLDIQDSFNYGMAEWGELGKPSEDMFRHVIDLDPTLKHQRNSNYEQCLAITFWILGKPQEADNRLKTALKMISDNPTGTFSCWRYMQVDPEEFKKDCQSIQSMINGENILPKFFQP